MKSSLSTLNNPNTKYDSFFKPTYAYDADSSVSPYKIVKTLNFDNREVLSFTYEVTENEVINNLLMEIHRLSKRVVVLEENANNKLFVVQDTLKEIWNNTKDDIWANI